MVRSGLTPDEQQQLAEWPNGVLLIEHPRGLPGTAGVRDFPGHVRAFGFAADGMPYKTVQGTPSRQRGPHTGSFFLADKEVAGISRARTKKFW